MIASDVALLAHRLPRVTAAGSTLPTAVVHASRPVDAVDDDLALTDLERAFRSPDLVCVAVRDTATDAVGLITRRRYSAALAGRLGFGRALLARATTGDLADWRPLVVEPDASIVDVALAAMERPDEARDDVVLVRAKEWHGVTPADLVLALTTLLAARSLHDPVTSLANRAYLVHQLRERSSRCRTTAHRVAVVQAEVSGLRAVNAEHGDEAGDEALAAVAAHVVRALPPGWVVGRTGADELTVVGTLPGPLDDAAAAAAVEVVRAGLAGYVPVTGPALPEGVRLMLRVGAVFSRAGGGSPDKLLAAVGAQLRELRRRSGDRLAVAP